MATFKLAGFNLSHQAALPDLGATPAELSVVSSPVDSNFHFTYLTDEF